MIELRIDVPAPPLMYCDNLSAVLLAANPILHSKSKHKENSECQSGSIQVADVFTKALPSTAFLQFQSILNVIQNGPSSEEGRLKSEESETGNHEKKNVKYEENSKLVEEVEESQSSDDDRVTVHSDWWKK
ncbi:hypothetical protein S83_027794 [Arachis hypogaea]|uniref:Uncharacterized protein n=1 Tax=Arachis hypogaea TaxID=3818 RepID=A0A445BP45_ARAHY|nr:hypothetical protein Ahy_A09g046202 isoform B [Arachis hypogaea]